MTRQRGSGGRVPRRGVTRCLWTTSAGCPVDTAGSSGAPRPTQRPEQLRGRVFRGATAVRLGLLTPNDLRSRAWPRLSPDVYADADLEITHALRARAVGRLLLPHGVLTGVSAAGLWGVELAGPDDDVEVTVAPGAPHSRAPGVTVAQFVVRHGRTFLARVDFTWPDHHVALAYEGAWHTTRIAEDRRRLETLQAAGRRVLFVTAADLHSPGPLLARIAATLGE